MTTLQPEQSVAESRARHGSRAAALPFRPHVVGAVFGRNFLGYFSNPAGYVFITLFVLVCSWAAFWQPVFFANNLANLDPLNEWMPYILLVFIPAITMNMWADERRQGTEELLLTLPARDVEVVLGKYLAAVGIYTVSLVFLAIGHVPLLMSLGQPDLGVLAATYLGYWLMGVMLIAVGMVASILSSNVTVAFILGAVFCAVPVFAGGMGPIGQMLASLEHVPGLGWLGRMFAPLAGGGAGQVVEGLSVPGQFRDFGAGVVTFSGLFYFVAMAAAMIYLNMVLLGRRHWAGGQASSGRWLHASVRVVAVVIALACLDVLVGRWLDVRIDATEERLHTLSPISRQIVREVPAERPIYIHAYISPDVPREYVEVKTNLINTLKEFAAIGGDQVRLELVETRRYSPEARNAEKRYGITPRRVPTSREGRQTSDEIYLGVAFTSGLEQVVIPFFDRGLPVEYELTRSIRVVSGTKRKRVGILETDAHLLGNLDFRTMSQEPEWAIVSELKKQYDVQSVSADVPIPFEEVQTVSLAGNPTGGSFTLSYEDKATGPIPVDADAAKVAEALASLEPIGPGNIKAEGGPLPKEPVRITFTGPFTGKDVAELTADSRLTGGENPRAKVGTTTEVLDALVVAQAPSLTQPQIDNLTTFVRRGGPTLLLMDPAPIIDPSLAPREPRPQAGGGMMGAQQQPEPKGNLQPLLASIGLEWPDDQIVWEPFNPHRRLDLEMFLEYVFIHKDSGARKPFGDDPTTSKLQEVFLPFPGLLREGVSSEVLEFTPLLRTSDLGGTLSFDEAVQRGPFGMSRIRPERPHFPSGRSYVVAARLQGKVEKEAKAKADRPFHVIAVADLDFISNSIFELRRRPVEELDEFDFDNVTFVLNCVDVLAGDETFLDLRKKRPRHRTLTTLEAEAKKFIDQSQAEQKKAEDNAKEQLEQARNRLNEAVEKIRQSTEYDEKTKESMVRYRERVEQRRLDIVEDEIEAEKDQAIELSRARREEAIASIENRIRSQAVVLTPLPALILGGIVFFVRSRRENRGANPERLA